MDLFDDKEIFIDKVEDHNAINIPDNLAWDKMGPAILEGIKKRKKRRRILIWWWGIGIAFIGFSLLGWCFRHQSILTNFSTSKLQKEATLSEARNKISKEKNKRKEEHLISREKTITQKTFEVNKLNIATNDKITTSKSSTDSLAELNSFTVSSIQSQSNKEFHITLLHAKEANSIKPRPTILIERLPILHSRLSDKTLEVTIPTAPIIKKTFSPKWQLEIGGGINWWQEGLIASRGIEPINTPQFGWQLNARINRHLTKFLTIKSGLQLQNLRYKSAFENTTEIEVYQPNTIDVIFINSLTGKQNISYRDSIPGLQTRKFQHYNQHTTLQLPILAGFTIGKKRWKYSLHTGVKLQFFQHSTGRIAFKKGTVIDLPNKMAYPNTLKISFLLEAQLAYQITNKLGIFNRWSMEMHLTNWLSSESQFQQRPKVGYGSFGLAWSF